MQCLMLLFHVPVPMFQCLLTWVTWKQRAHGYTELPTNHEAGPARLASKDTGTIL